MMTEAKNAIVSWLLNFRIRMFVKSAVISKLPKLVLPGYSFNLSQSPRLLEN